MPYLEQMMQWMIIIPQTAIMALQLVPIATDMPSARSQMMTTSSNHVRDEDYWRTAMEKQGVWVSAQCVMCEDVRV